MRRTSSFRFASLVAASLTGVSGCGGFFSDWVTAGYVGGSERYYTYETWSAGGEREVVGDEASRELACAAGELTIAQPYSRAYLVTGCGKRGVFVTASLSDQEPRKIPGSEDDAIVTYWRAVNVLAPVAPPPAPVSHGDYMTSVKTWVRLVQQGAKDLDCDPKELLPDIVPQGRAPSLPLVEGCGNRATYIGEVDTNPLRLVSIVPIK